jgi:hypothetical protein
MRKVNALDESTGSNNMQDDEPCSYAELLQCLRSDYERMDVAKPKPVQMAQVSWSTADVLRNASNLTFAIEAHRRGMSLVGAKNILSGKYSSGRKIHKRKKRKGN